VVKTTRSHLFWNQTSHRWTKAAALKYGTHLRAARGGSATVLGGYTPRVTTGWMWDLTIPGNNDHDFYVESAIVLPSSWVGPTAAVLVHNSNCGGARFSVDSAGTVTDSQGPAGILLNKASGDGFRDTVASFYGLKGGQLPPMLKIVPPLHFTRSGSREYLT
jgi:hypothetical protein